MNDLFVLKKLRFLKPCIPALVILAIVIAALSGYEPSEYEAKAPATPEPVGTIQETPVITLPDTTALPEEAKTEGAPSAGAIKSLASVDDSDVVYKDGTYTGSAQGYGGTISVSVTISDGEITEITVLSASDETPSYFNQARGVIDRIMNAQSTNVDVVSGATYSSNGIIQAVRNALSKASVNTSSENVSNETTPAVNKPVAADQEKKQAPEIKKIDEKESVYQDGVYSGAGEGYGGEIKVEVTVLDGKIAKVVVLEASEETAEYYEMAKVLTGTIVSKQSTNVDAVSGATWSSNGIIEAVRDALKKAQKTDTTDQDSKKPESEQTDSGTNIPDEGEDENTSDNPGADDPEKENPGTDDSGSDGEQDTVIRTVTAMVYCDEYEDFSDYEMSMDVTLRNGRITAIDNIRNTDGDSENIKYCMAAAYGEKASEKMKLNNFFKNMTAGKKGVATQITEKGLPEGIDVISGATCSSDAIIRAAKDALE